MTAQWPAQWRRPARTVPTGRLHLVGWKPRLVHFFWVDPSGRAVAEVRNAYLPLRRFTDGSVVGILERIREQALWEEVE